MPFAVLYTYSGSQTQPTRKGLGKNLARKCLECWNATVSVDEGTNITSANQRLSSINDRKRIYSRT